MKLRKVDSIELTPSAPFNFDTTFHKPDHFHSADNDWKPGIRWQTWYWNKKQLGLRFSEKGTTHQPRVLVDIYFNKRIGEDYTNSLAEEIRYRFNLNLVLADFYDSFAKDSVLGPIIKRWKGMRPGHPNSLYEYLIIGIVLQNATVKRSIQMYRTLTENYGTLLEYNHKQL